MVSTEILAADATSSEFNASHSRGVLAVCIVTIVFSGLFYAARIASRRMTKQALDLSDHILLFGMLCTWIISATTIWGITQGLGQHLVKLEVTNPGGISNAMKSLIATEVLYLVALACIKTSLCLLYKKIFPGDLLHMIINAIIAVNILWAIACSFVSIFTCRPVRAFWTLELMPTAKCIDMRAFYIGNWVPNITTDLIVAFLPQSKVWKLQTTVRSKIILAGMFLLGSFVMVASVYRLTVLFSFNMADATSEWTIIELLAAIASACMPLLRPVYQKIVPRALRLDNSTSAKSSTSALHGIGTNLTNRGAKPSYVHGKVLSATKRELSDFERLTDDEEAGGSHSYVMQPTSRSVISGRDDGLEPSGRSNGGSQDGILVTREWHTHY